MGDIILSVLFYANTKIKSIKSADRLAQPNLVRFTKLKYHALFFGSREDSVSGVLPTRLGVSPLKITGILFYLGSEKYKFQTVENDQDYNVRG